MTTFQREDSIITLSFMHFKNKHLNFLKVELILIAKVNLKKLLSCNS